MVILYIIIGFVAFIFLFQKLLALKMKFKKGKAAPQLEGRYKKAITGDNKSLFYFYSQSCAACRPMTPIVDKFAGKKNVFKVDIARDMDVAKKFGVLGTPSTVVVEKGIIKEFLVGPQTESKLAELLK